MQVRTRWIVLGVVAMLGTATVGAWQYVDRPKHRPQTQIHDTAEADAAKKIDDVLDQFSYDHLYKADDYARTAGQFSGVQVLSVTGQTHWQTGVTLVLKVIGHGVVIGADRSVIRERYIPICFRIQLGPDADSRDDDIDCPPGAPIPIAPDPSLRGVDDRLRNVLDSVAPDKAAVRAAVASLKLNPAIRQDIVARDGMVGVALRATQYDCVMARVTSEGVRLWRPSRIQLAPGELGCSAVVALGSEFGTYPH